MSSKDGSLKKQLEEAKEHCSIFVNHHRSKTMKQWFELLENYIEVDKKPDGYGEGNYLQAFESEIAELLGKEAAVFMPSGTMAQQIALRIWTDKTHNKQVVMHPTAHPEMAEHFAYQYLHNLQRIQLQIPDFTSQRLLKAEDFTKLKEIPGAVLLELPQRPIGGQLPDWNELCAISEWAKDLNVKLHLDGARLWEAQPYYDRSLKEIAALFDSVYVSFYKGLDGIAGAMLLGPKSFIEKSKIWQRRMGGNLRSQFPLYVAAKWGFEENLPRMSDYYQRTKQLAEHLNTIQYFETNPTVPQTNMFHLYIRASQTAIKKAQLQLAENDKIWLINSIQPAIIPAYCWTEIVIASSAMDLEFDELVAAFEQFASYLEVSS